MGAEAFAAAEPDAVAAALSARAAFPAFAVFVPFEVSFSTSEAKISFRENERGLGALSQSLIVHIYYITIKSKMQYLLGIFILLFQIFSNFLTRL